MPKITVISHVLTGIVHGGTDDFASLTLWLDREQNVAHMTGHSGSINPLNGPTAPEDAPKWDANGRKGYVMIAEEGEIEDLRLDLERLLFDYGDDQVEDLDGFISGRLQDFNLAEELYEDWLAREDPATYREVFG